MPKPPTFQSPTATPAAIVDALKAVAGDPPKVRASFAKGRCVRGTYVPSDRAEEITRSRSFTRPSRVLARFSVGSSHSIATNRAPLLLRGFSFRLGDAHHSSDILTQSAPVHFAKTLEQMLACLKAHIPGPDGNPDIERVKAFSAANPEAMYQASYITAHPLPRNFAGTTYWGVHSFPATNSAGETRFIKFKVAPVGANVSPAESGVMADSDKLLHDDMEHRITSGNVRFSLMALLDRPGDPTMDVTIRWPDEDDRDEVRLGTIVITGLEPDQACDASIFDPANLAEGIAHPPDEIFAARRAAYALSLAKRR
ncbi:catalase [Bradyrhizobium sp. CIAT3101]|uniref:catalase n=1 Tax=Bradyrhizobium sp. CIAT3101 TaxID=439387 RepID=UPI0024B124A4|nr:catalase [Bradyrhizobium sp. CIAT3101]WFU85520.1 catalase [Bradyrhizobium sp. CIAT3101]